MDNPTDQPETFEFTQGLSEYGEVDDALMQLVAVARAIEDLARVGIVAIPSV